MGVCYFFGTWLFHGGFIEFRNVDFVHLQTISKGRGQKKTEIVHFNVI